MTTVEIIFLTFFIGVSLLPLVLFIVHCIHLYRLAEKTNDYTAFRKWLNGGIAMIIFIILSLFYNQYK